MKIKNIFAALICLALIVSCATFAIDTAKSTTRLVLLGTAAGPSLQKARAQPSNALIINDSVYIIDTGNGVARQMELANISAQKLRGIFITHNHTDHNADYGTLLIRSWLSGLKTQVNTFGPKPLKQKTSAYLKYMDWDIKLRIRDEHRVPLKDLINAHDIKGDGVIYQDENVKVTAFEVTHGAAKPSYGFRFDTADRSIVFSGDTSRSDNLIKHAKDADILVHEVINVDGVDSLINTIDPGNKELKRHILEAHTPIEEVGKVATEANVKKLVLSHLAPTGLPDFDKPEVWLKGIRKSYQGEVIIGEDLLEIK